MSINYKQSAKFEHPSGEVISKGSLSHKLMPGRWGKMLIISSNYFVL